MPTGSEPLFAWAPGAAPVTMPGEDRHRTISYSGLGFRSFSHPLILLARTGSNSLDRHLWNASWAGIECDHYGRAADSLQQSDPFEWFD